MVALSQNNTDVFYCPSRRVAKPYPFKRSGETVIGPWLLAKEKILLLTDVTKSDYAVNSGNSIYGTAEQFSDEPEMWVPKNYDDLKTKPQLWTDTTARNTKYFQSGTSYYRSQVRSAQVIRRSQQNLPLRRKVYQARILRRCGGANAQHDGRQPIRLGRLRVGQPPRRLEPWFALVQRCLSTTPRWRTPPEYAGCFAFGSAHPSSLNMAFCDGSVRDVAYDIDTEVHRHQANRLDGE